MHRPTNHLMLITFLIAITFLEMGCDLSRGYLYRPSVTERASRRTNEDLKKRIVLSENDVTVTITKKYKNPTTEILVLKNGPIVGVSSGNPIIAIGAVVEENGKPTNKIEITGKAAGPTTITLSNEHGQKADLNVVVLVESSSGSSGKQPVKQETMKLIEQLHSGDSLKRANAAHALGGKEHAPELVVLPLTNALSDPDGQVRRDAAESLGEKGPSAIDAYFTLVEVAFEDEEGGVREQAKKAIFKIRPTQKGDISFLEKTLQDEQNEGHDKIASRTL